VLAVAIYSKNLKTKGDDKEKRKEKEYRNKQLIKVFIGALDIVITSFNNKSLTKTSN
jgi:hypothetical protein